MAKHDEGGLAFDGAGATVTFDPATATIVVRDGRFRRILSFD